MNEEDTMFFDKTMDMMRRKVFESVTGIKQKALILASIGKANRKINDFGLLLEFLSNSDSDKDLKSVCVQLAQAGFLDEARSVASRIIDTEIWLEAWLCIASVSKNGNDFQTVSSKIDELEQELKLLPEPADSMEYRIKDANRNLIEALQYAGKYVWAKKRIKKIKYGEFLLGNLGSVMIKKAYHFYSGVPELIIHNEGFENLPAAFKYSAEYGTADNAVEAIYLLLKADEVQKAISLIEVLEEDPYDAVYIKAKSYIQVALKLDDVEYLKKAAHYAMKERSSVVCVSKDRARDLLTQIGIIGRSTYYLGLAMDVALKGDRPLGDVECILETMSNFKEKLEQEINK